MRRWLSGIMAASGIALIGLLFGLTPLGIQMEQNMGLRFLFRMRGPVAPPPDVAVVAIDDQTGAHLELSRLPRDWPRSSHGRLVDALVRAGASAIVFDFDFQTPKQPKDDALFAKSIAAAGRVILTEKLIGKRQPLFDKEGKVKGALWVEQLVAPMPMLADAAKGAGTFPLPKVDVAVHEFWAFKNGVDYAPTTPAMGLQIRAREQYPGLIALLEDAGVKEAAGLPRRIEASDRTPEIRSIMMELRRLFTRTPELEMTLREALKQKENGKLDDGANSRLLEALIGLYAGGDHRYLNFYGPPGSILTVPYHKVIQGESGPGGKALPDLKGKVVFVGYSDLYDPSQPDRFYTVYTNADGVDLSGVEIAATAYANLLTGRSLVPADPVTAIAVQSAFGGIVGGTALILPAIVSVPLIFILSGAYVYLAELAFAENEIWLPLAVPLLLQLPLALFSGLLTQYLSERRKKKRATQAISFYLPEKLAKDFAEKNLESSALNRVTYSVCFASDMAGFTTISEQLPPKELAGFLNDYFESLSCPLRCNGVDVVEFRADGIMCAWTAEKNFEVIRRRAAVAALEAVEAISLFSRRYPLLSQQLRIGLEAGMVYVGHSGGGGHFVYSIVGDCANTSARIEGLNKKMGTQILAGKAAVEGVDELLLRYLGDFQFVGKTEAQPVFEVLALKDEASPAQELLSRRYQEAMTVLSDGRIPEALALFEAISSDYPEDGPARFHSAYCLELMKKPELPENPAVIRLDSK
ncbi:CHASE2 domain-containing protein [Methylosarcina fibrata]|uniref:CHASE2 domain-containing protein n=1 Tax=Methylosarcina fibrata TaxID=105972 RepID=UPI0018DEE980|nr:adenylate/guanylate cyclase domain-containing protein [Methylosarcina fibrata]